MQSFRKYRNIKVEVDGIKFASKLESNIYKELKLLKKAKQCDFNLQPKYELQPRFKFNGKVIRPINYIADFNIIKNGINYVVDTKGFETVEFKIKCKMMLYVHNIEVIKIKSVKKFYEWYGGIN